MKIFYFLIFCFLLISCLENEELEPVFVPNLMEIPKGFPEIIPPEDNEFTTDRWELGKRLFFEKAMSVDSSISCASCHDPNLAFSDEVAFSAGVGNQLGTRNSPSLANVGYQPYLTREGGVPTLEMQVLIPIQEHNEFNFNIVLIADRLSEDSSYNKMAQKAYGREVDAFVITRALSCFERSLISGFSPYDQYQNYQKEEALSDAEIRGMELFFSEKTNCSKCHNGFNFTNYTFENNGLYETYDDEGRYRLTGLETDRALFKVPSLRNIELTAPYMHDGSLNTLEEIVQHYQTGGNNHPNKSNYLYPLQLSESERSELILFLKTLTDDSFVNNPIFKQ